MTKLSLLKIVEDTTVDGPGFRTAVYSAGCPHHCPGCHNPQSWEMEKGENYSVEQILEKIKQAEFSNVTFSGGDPLWQVEGFTELAQRIKKETGKTIWCYTGYTYEAIIASRRLSRLLPYLDVLVDGPFIQQLKDPSLRFAGSTNQRIIDVAASQARSKVVLWPGGVSAAGRQGQGFLKNRSQPAYPAIENSFSTPLSGQRK